ncbi:GntR family transcriptional regulator [Caballeronia sordidicola]|jgi:DNA-binding GntR family transcriptional regulator|uniref:Transcriptional regulator, GntR family n=1 Tax=Caballeronia sordidicola TaxID=196367 RepID=A0A226WT02_CABSO|nr:GntR family transcriptional regulator [Caballeronia sordidicola]OXC74325.1 Transcriptional regulator, GntR family [Caballeronia sordidicola]
MKADRNDAQQFIARLLPPGYAIDRSKGLSVQLYELLRQAIVTMVLQPKEVIYDRAISDTLGISRTPVREALLQLAREELVVIAAQSSTYVAPVLREQFIESAFIRKVLETASIRRAAEIITEKELEQLKDIHEAHRRAIKRGNSVAAIRHDNEFHALVSQAARLPKVQQLVEVVRAPIDRVRHITVRDPKVGEATLRQHQKILDTLIKHDPAAAEKALIDHLEDAFTWQQKAFDAKAQMFAGLEKNRHGEGIGAAIDD